MLRNSQFSHILLLVVIGFAIYYLTCPDKSIKNTGTLEQITSVSDDDKEKEISDEPSPSSEEEEGEQILFGEEARGEAKGIVSEVEEELNQNEEVEQPVEDDNNTVDKAVQRAQSVNTFKPNQTEGGANLNAAFNKPVPKGTDTNAVDFNRNYLKKYDSNNYLPKEHNDDWFDTDFSQAKNKLDSDKLINTEKYVIGVDTVGQSLKNASYDLRGTVANPKYNVSPWLNSTYEPDYNIKPLC